MQILLINHSLYTGGVETLMVRMANWLVRNGHGCGILLRDTFDGDLTPMLDPKVRLRVVGNQWDLLAVPCVRGFVWKSWSLPKPDCIYTLEQNWTIVGMLVRTLFPDNPPKIATGAYHINQFAYEYVPEKWGVLDLLRQEIYDKHYLDEQKFFMSEETRQGHERFFKRTIPDGWVWPLPIEFPDEQTLESRRPVPHRIVSIGRLTRFKTYSWYMVPVMHELRLKYPDVQWHVYGFGMCERELVDEVWKDAIGDGLIVFHGPISYGEIKRAFDEAAVFIGMGTTLLEAAATGVPCIPALVDDPDAKSWGFIDQMPYFTVGETVPGMNPTENVIDLIDRLFQMSDHEVRTVAQKGRDYSLVYSMDQLMESFLQQVRTLPIGRELDAGIRLRYTAIRFVKMFRNLYLSLSRIGKPPLRHPSGDRIYY
jgi:glycosyltransferase involved in cell wall biosynthesis